MKGNTMKNLSIAIAATIAVLYVIGRDATKQKEIDELKARVERLKRWNKLYYATVKDTVPKLDREERRDVVRKFNEEFDFIKITNNF